MNKRLMIGLGLILILVGVASFGATILGWLFGFRMWQLWPLLVIGAGLGLTLPAIFGRPSSGLQVMPLIGFPTLTTGVLLLIGSVLRWWQIWTILWPLELISIALGCLWIVVRTKATWVLVPAIILGANGLILQFCAATGWWGAWSVLWTVEPVALGISLLVLNTRRRSTGLMTAGLILCAIGALGFLQSVAFLSLAAFRPLRWLWRWLVPVATIVTGGVLVISPLTRHHAETGPAPIVEG